MTVLRARGVSALDTPTYPRLRVRAVSASTPAVATARLRVRKISATGVGVPVLLPIEPETVEPGALCTVTAILADSTTADSYQWRQVSGPTVSLTGSGSSVTFEAPSAMPPGAAVVVGVRATAAGAQSVERQVTFTVLPQTEWTRVHGGTWVGSRSSAAPSTPDGYDIIVAMIQSNMRGAATDYTAADQYAADVYMWDHASQSIVQAKEPQANWDNFNGMGGSNTFVKDYQAQALATGRKVLIVNTTRGGTGFTTPSSNSFGNGFHWRHDLADDANNLARRARDTIQAALAAAGPGSQVVAFCANHGSTDGTNNTPKATFKAYLQAWISWLRAELGAESVPYLMMQMRPDLIAAETRHRNIADAQAETAAELSNVGYALAPVGSEFYKADVVHFNAAGVRAIGHNLFDSYLALTG